MEHTTIINKDYTEVCPSEGTDDNDSVATSTSNTSTYCSICLETELLDKRYIKFPCDHIFHVHCFEAYIDYNISHKPDSENISCPICRASFSKTSLKHVFNVSQEYPNHHITLLLQPDMNEEPDIVQQRDRARGCTKNDLIALVVLLTAITIFLLIIYNV